jgi:mycothiol synthase
MGGSLVEVDYPQLKMTRRQWSGPAERQLASEFTLREATQDDCPGLAKLMQLTFGAEWDEAKVGEELLRNPNVPMTFVIEQSGVIVAGASYQIKADWPGAGWIHYVAASPAFAGRGLGYAVSLRVIQESLGRGDEYQMLTTDDWRLPAIATYLKLGFEPDCWHESHLERWADVKDGLRSTQPPQFRAK